ncbi:thioredoxin [Deinococcus aluminii]|uniref:Thioredoxin n=1 Tax=Deinococcus aluminii TaxID=1656885 RepID=A0ABP9XDB0_9DEIO
MAERPFVLLTQEHCPQCERLERMLAGPLKGQFTGQIEVVHRQQRPAEFEALAQAYGIRATPMLLHRPSGEVLLGPTGLGEVHRFLGR